MPDDQDFNPKSAGGDQRTFRRPRFGFHVSILQLFLALTVTAILVWSNLILFRQSDKVDDSTGLRIVTFQSGWPFLVRKLYGVVPIESTIEVSSDFGKTAQKRNINWLALAANVVTSLATILLLLGVLRYVYYVRLTKISHGLAN